VGTPMAIKGSASFLKKRSKKLWSNGFSIAYGVGHAAGNSEPSIRSFFWFFFFKKRTALLT
jgi:hypothetical protein